MVKLRDFHLPLFAGRLPDGHGVADVPDHAEHDDDQGGQPLHLGKVKQVVGAERDNGWRNLQDGSLEPHEIAMDEHTESGKAQTHTARTPGGLPRRTRT